MRIAHRNESSGLTDDVEVNKMAHVGGRRDLALVYTAVPVLRILYLERPVVRLTVVNGTKSLVARVRVTSYGQQVYVPVTHPRHLQHHLKSKRNSRSSPFSYSGRSEPNTEQLEVVHRCGGFS